jgi:hypothetical protein
MESTPFDTHTKSTGGSIVVDTIEVDFDALRQLNAEINLTPSPDEFTRNQYAEANHMTRDQARGILSHAIQDGKVSTRKLRNTVYYKRIDSIR